MYWVPEKKNIFNECISQNCESQPITHKYFLKFYMIQLNFELSFIGIHRRLTERWLFPNKCQNRV